ncbi:MAG: hypothetical protein HOP28_06240 [Gemmatimonadales bacterium]|nr:hypothetical protein [Gemmatimonadales bacterium]
MAKPDAEFPESFTRVTAIRELPSGKVLMTDASDKVVNLLDFASGSATKVGREGKGPGEYALPTLLVPLPDGSTLVQDPVSNRFLTISPDGKPGDLVDIPQPPAGNGGQQVMTRGLGVIRGFDARGRIYFEGPSFSMEGPPPDSVVLLRWDRVKTTFDTVGYRTLAKAGATTTQSLGGGTSIRIGGGFGAKMFAPTETWGVAGDGSVARVFPNPYRVGWMNGPGKVALGPAVPYTPIKVTEAEKKEITDAAKNGTSGAPAQRVTFSVTGGGGGTQTLQAPPPEFEDSKAPYNGAGAVLVAPEGEVWVLRTRVHPDPIPTYDVFNRAGALVKSVSLNAKSRVVGFGKGAVYVVRNDEDDLQYLQRYKRP